MFEYLYVALSLLVNLYFSQLVIMMNPLQNMRTWTRDTIVNRAYIVGGSLAIVWGAWFFQDSKKDWDAIEARLNPVSEQVLSLEQQLSDRYSGRDLALNSHLSEKYVGIEAEIQGLCDKYGFSRVEVTKTNHDRYASARDHGLPIGLAVALGGLCLVVGTYHEIADRHKKPVNRLTRSYIVRTEESTH